MSGGSQSQTQFTKQDPWDPAQPSLIKSLGAANNAFDTTYNGSSVAAMDPAVTQSLNTQEANANSGLMTQLANLGLGGIQSILGNGGLSKEQSNAISGLTGALGNFNNQATTTSGYLSPIASGSMIGDNPYLNKSIQDSMDQTSAALNRQFSGAGRYGSGAYTQVMTNSLGKIANDARAAAYENDSNRQLQAIQALGQLNDSTLSGNLSGQAALSQLGQQRLANAAGVLQSIPSFQEAQNADANSLGAVGGKRMDYNQQVIDAANQDPWTKAQNLAQIAQGIGGMGGTSFSVSQTKSNPGIMSTIGGLISGAGGLSNAAKGIASFGALFSDERLKENIEPVGKLDNGAKIYAYNFKGDGTPQIGLLAQEIEKTHPEAVIDDPATGFKKVNYGIAARKKSRTQMKEAA